MHTQTVLYVHGKGGSAEEAEHYKPLFQGHPVVGFDYKAETPWDAKKEFSMFADSLCKESGPLILIANSIGAYFSMHALTEQQIEKAFLISPIVDMETLITRMMTWAGVTEEALRERKEIPTDFGETLSWSYLQYVREHPIQWSVPTHILYGGKDHLTAQTTIADFARRTGAQLTVLKQAEHWFHTDDQMAFLDAWITHVL